MEIRFIFSSYLALIIISPMTLLANSQVIKYQVEVGSTLDLQTTPTSGFHISRKGIISLHRLNDENWQIIGLQRGIVVLSPFSKPEESILIKSIRNEKKKFLEKKYTKSTKLQKNFVLNVFAHSRSNKNKLLFGGKQLLKIKNLDHNKEQKNSHVIADTSIISTIDQSFKLKIGKDNSRNIIKREQYEGFEFYIEGFITKIRGKYIFQYTIKIKSDNSRERTDTSHVISSKQVIVNEKEFKIASFFLRQRKDVNQNIQPLNHIPILAPLTRNNREENQNIYLEIRAKLKLL